MNRRKDGSEIPILLSITPIHQDGEKVGYMGVEIDISEKKKIEDQLIKEKEFSESVIETANCLIVSLDLEGKITLFNRKCEEVTGYSRHEVLGKSWFDLLLPRRWQPDVGEVFNSIIEGQFPSRYENHILTKNEDERLISWSNTAVRNEKHEIVGALGIGIDITEQKSLENQVLQAERLATIGKMAAKVAHEIRNPLSSISLNVELLEDEIFCYESVDTDEAKALLKSLTSEIDRVTALTEEYLQFSRLPESQLVKGNINHVIEELAEFLRLELEHKKIKLEFHIQREISKVRFDRVQIRRALLNIIRNAVEAMPKGGKLKMWTEQKDHKALIHIEDTGIGILEDEKSKIFDPFYTTKDFGTGLGLAIVRQIIDEHGGQICCDSKVGQGTTFSIILPIDETEGGN
jgi:PAS domain S-box-containing protein